MHAYLALNCTICTFSKVYLALSLNAFVSSPFSLGKSKKKKKKWKYLFYFYFSGSIPCMPNIFSNSCCRCDWRNRNKKLLVYYVFQLYIALLSRSWKSLYRSFPPRGTLLTNMSIDIRQRALPFIRNRSKWTDGKWWVVVMYWIHLATSSRLHCRGSEKTKEKKSRLNIRNDR